MAWQNIGPCSLGTPPSLFPTGRRLSFCTQAWQKAGLAVETGVTLCLMTSWTFWYRAVSCAGPLCRQAAWARWLLCLSTFSHSLTIACQQHEMNLLLLVGLLLLLQLGKLHP